MVSLAPNTMPLEPTPHILFQLQLGIQQFNSGTNHPELEQTPQVKGHGLVIGIPLLGFPKIEIQRKLKIFQTDFINLMLEHKGSNAKERKVLRTDCGSGSQLGCFYKLGSKVNSSEKASFFKVAGFLKKAGFLYWPCFLVPVFGPALLGWMVDCSLLQEGRSG